MTDAIHYTNANALFYFWRKKSFVCFQLFLKNKHLITTLVCKRRHANRTRLHPLSCIPSDTTLCLGKFLDKRKTYICENKITCSTTRVLNYEYKVEVVFIINLVIHIQATSRKCVIGRLHDINSNDIHNFYTEMSG